MWQPCCVCGRTETNGHYSIEDKFYCFAHGRAKNEERKDELNREMLGELLFGDPTLFKKKG